MPTLFPTRAFRRTRERASGLLLALGVDDLSSVIATGQTLTFDRAASRTVFDSVGRVATIVYDQPSWSSVYNSTDGVWEPVLDIASQKTNVCLQSENLGTTWAAISTPTRTAAAATCGDLVLDLVNDTSAAALQGYSQAVTPSGGNGTKGVSLFMKAGTSTSSVVRVRDTTASANRLLATITWSSGVPTVTMTTGTHCGTVACYNGVYRFLFQTTTWTVANTTQIELYPATTSALAVANTGSAYFGGIMVESDTFPAGTYLKTTTTSALSADDTPTTTIDWPPQNCTVYARFSRPAWLSGTAPSGSTAVYLYSIASSGGSIDAYYSLNTSQLIAQVTDGTTPRTVSASLPAGQMLDVCIQYDGLPTAGRVRMDTGSSFGSYSSTTGAFSSWGGSTFRVGHTQGALARFDSGIRKLIIAPGARTLAEMRGLNV